MPPTLNGLERADSTGAGSMAMGEWVSVTSARDLAVLVSALLSVAGLFAIGALITLFTGRGILHSGGRQVIIGGAAAALSYERVTRAAAIRRRRRPDQPPPLPKVARRPRIRSCLS